MNTVLAIDFDRWASETYRVNFPETRVEFARVGDLVASLPYADLIIAGPPCQPHSLAGTRGASKDERDGGDDFSASVAKVKPRHFLMENVPGLLSSEGGRYWQRLYALLESAGYTIQYRILDALDFGAPQFRSRLWVWGIRNDLYALGIRHCWPMPTHAWPWPQASMFGFELLPAVTVGWALDIPHRQIDGIWFPGNGSMSRVMGGGRNDIDRGDGHFRRDERDITGEPSTTIAGRFMGTHKGAQNPRIVSILDAQNETLHPVSEPIGTIQGNAQSKGGRAGHHIHEYRWSDAMLEKHPPASPASPASTVQAKWFKGGAEGLVEVTVDPKHPFQQQQPANTITSGGSGHGPTENSLKLFVDTKQARTRQPIESPSPTVAHDSRHTLTGKQLVRRLTPLECMRLMSAPDDFRWPEGISKTAMYKIAGNGHASIQVWNLRNALLKSDPQIRMVIDLFCGGGLGACGLHGRYWEYKK